MAANTNVNLVYPEYNKDGLAINYGRSEAIVGRGGDVQTTGDQHVALFKVDYADVALGTGATSNFVLSYTTMIPKGAVITKCEFLVTTAWDSTSSDVALNFGLVKNDATNTTGHTIVDADGLMDTVAKTVIDLAGNLVVTQAPGSYPDITTYAGAELGTARAENQLVTCFWENHAPTQGAGVLRVYYRGA